MTFNEENTIENALRDHLCGKVKDEEQRVNGEVGRVNEEFAPYVTKNSPPAIPDWKFVHGEDLELHGKQPQDVFVAQLQSHKMLSEGRVE